MTSRSDGPERPERVSEALLDALDDLGSDGLRAVHEYIEERLAYVSTSVGDRIEAGPGEEIVDVREHDGYTLVSKRMDCESGCSDCPHGPYLYLVRTETRPDGDTSLHWSYVGRVRDDTAEP